MTVHDCNTMQRLLHPYLDHELNVMDSMEIHAHLIHCVPYRTGLEQVARECGAFAFIRKPFTPKTVQDMVRRAGRPDKVGQTYPLRSDSRSTA